MLFPKALRRWPSWLVLVEALILVGLIGWFDHATGWEWSFFAPFAVPIILITWRTGWRLGLGCASLCAVAFWLAHLGNNPYRTNWGFAVAVLGRWFYFAILVVAVAAVLAKRELDRAHIQTLERKRELERQVLRTSEREQERIGRDLHDSLGPHLAAIRYAATFLAKELRQRERPEAAQADKIEQMTGGALALARNLARGIFPAPMEGGSLSLALEELARATSSQTGMAVVFCETGDPRITDPEEGLHLYRIAQEALTNAAKHGGARKVTMVLHKSADFLRLALADDGKGMPLEPTGANGMGLDSMRYRARALGGELRIESPLGEGTLVSCEIPIRAPGPAAPAP